MSYFLLDVCSTMNQSNLVAMYTYRMMKWDLRWTHKCWLSHIYENNNCYWLYLHIIWHTWTYFSISSLLCHHFLLLQPGLPPWTSLGYQLLQYLSVQRSHCHHWLQVLNQLQIFELCLTASWCFLKSLLSFFSLPLSSSLLSSLSNGSILLEPDAYVQ